MKHHIMETNNGPVHYWIDGVGKECLFFTHGMSLTHQIFLPQLAYFRENYTVILWDVPAHGLSRPYKKYNQTECTTLMARILERESIPSAHIIGESMGGYIAQEFAARYPEKTRSLALIGSHPLGREYYWPIEKFLLKNCYAIVKRTPYPLMLAVTVAFSGRNVIGKETTRLSIMQHSKEEIVDISKNVYIDFLSYEEDLLFSPTIPVGVFFGKRDYVGRLKRVNKIWAKKRGYHVSEIPRAAHNVNIDHPHSFNQAFNYFLEEGLSLMKEPEQTISEVLAT